MHLMKEQEWKAILQKTGFFGVATWRVNSSKDWKGTLVITGKTKQFLQNLQRRQANV